MAFNIHLHETAAEVEHSRLGIESMSRHRSDAKMSPLENFERLGMVSPRLVAVHMTQLTDSEVELLAKRQGAAAVTGPARARTIAGILTEDSDALRVVLLWRVAHVVHCPFSNLKLASGFCPVAKLLTAGVNVCIGTGTTTLSARGALS